MLPKTLRCLQRFSRVEFRYSSQYRDKTPLREDDINQILYKNVQKANVNYETPRYTLESPAYNEKIEQLLERVKQQSERFEYEEHKQEEKQEDKQEEETQSIVAKQDVSDMQDVKYYKYGLPIPNMNPKVEDDYEKKKLENLQATITMNMFDLFKLDKESSYEQYERESVQYLSVAQDMYGRTLESPLKDLQMQSSVMENNAIPMNRINDEKYMKHILKCYSLNLSMPGTIENEHPHRFMKNIRPVEEFRHTPLIPISERQMKEFQDKVESSHRRGFLLEVKKDSVYQLFFGLFIMSIVYQIFKLVLEKEEQYGVAFQRLKNKRLSHGQHIL